MAKHTAWYQLNFGWLRLRPRRRFKDRLFRFLFRHKKDLLLKTAIANAIDTCNQKGILEDVLLIAQELGTEPGVIRKLIDKISGGGHQRRGLRWSGGGEERMFGKKRSKRKPMTGRTCGRS